MCSAAPSSEEAPADERVSALQARLLHADNVLYRIKHGYVDAIVVSDTAGRHDVYTLEGRDRPCRALIERMQEGIVTLDTSGTILYGNQRLSSMMGVPHENLIGHDLHAFLIGSEPAAFSDMLAASIIAPASKEFQLRGSAPEPLPVCLSLSLLKGEEKALLCGVLTDLTEHKKHVRQMADANRETEVANAKLASLARDYASARDCADQANRAKTRFLAGMSHELRTPLNGILGYAQLLRMDGGLTPTQSERVQSMLTEGMHLLEMISCILDLSEIEGAGAVLRTTPVNVGVLLAACIDVLRPAAEAKNLRLLLAIAPGTPLRLITDATRLRQVLLNLIGNAVKFTSDGTVSLRVASLEQATKIRFEVVDTGPGVGAEPCHRLLGDFERIEIGVGALIEGAGLGLSLSQQLAQMMGGHLGYEDNPVGGSIFWLEIPLAAAPGDSIPKTAQAAAGAPRKTAPAPCGLSPEKAGLKRVMVVDDVAMNRDIAATFLRSAGYETVCVEGGAQAIAVARDSDFSAILMDVRMPGVDGLQATRGIRNLVGPRALVPIIALTAQVFTEQIEACRAAGMNTHLAKPFTLDSLLGAITRETDIVDAGLAAGPQDIGHARKPTIPVASDHASLHLLLPVIDIAILEQTVAMLSPAMSSSCLLALAENSILLLGDLRARGSDVTARAALSASVHRLASRAGLFGFKRLVFAAREFERKAECTREAAGDPILDLCEALDISIEDMRRLSNEALKEQSLESLLVQGGGGTEGGKHFFFEKKKQKTFDS